MRFRLAASAVATAMIVSCTTAGSAGPAACANELFRVGPAALLPPAIGCGAGRKKKR